MKLISIIKQGQAISYIYADDQGNYKIVTERPKTWDRKAKKYKLNYKEFNRVG